MRVVALLVLLCGGCSWVFVTPAPPGARVSPALSCTDHGTAPGFDTAGMVAGMVGTTFAVIIGVAKDTSTWSTRERATAMAFPIATTLYALATGYGKHHVARCRRLKGLSNDDKDEDDDDVVRSRR